MYVFDGNEEFDKLNDVMNEATDEIVVDNRFTHLLKHIVSEVRKKNISTFKPPDYDSILETFGC